MQSACPCCGRVAARTTYDIGSGPELSCADCEWCWGADGQGLAPVTLESTLAWMQADGHPGADVLAKHLEAPRFRLT